MEVDHGVNQREEEKVANAAGQENNNVLFEPAVYAQQNAEFDEAIEDD